MSHERATLWVKGAALFTMLSGFVLCALAAILGRDDPIGLVLILIAAGAGVAAMGGWLLGGVQATEQSSETRDSTRTS